MKIEFEIPGEAVAKGRPRIGKFGTYTPKKTVNYENWVRLCYRQKYAGIRQLEGRLRASIDICMAITKSTTKKNKELMNGGKSKWEKLD